MKRSLSFILSLLMIFSFANISVYADVTPESSVLVVEGSDVEAELISGNKIIYEVKATSNPGFSVSQIIVTWPTDNLSLSNIIFKSETNTDCLIEDNEGTEFDPSENDGTVYVSIGSDTSKVNITSTGILFKLEFTVLNSAVTGDNIISCIPEDGFTYNAGGEEVQFSAKEGNITLYKKLSSVNISLTAPVTGSAPETSVSGTGFTGSVTWNPSVNSNKFAGSTAYTASIELTPLEGYRFASSTNVSVNGGEAVSATPSEGKVTVSKAFDATEAKSLTGITVKSNPTKTSYTHGDTINTSGMTVTGTYNDGSEETITDYSIEYKTKTGYLCAGDTSVTVKKGDYSDSVSGLTVGKKTVYITELTATDRQYDGTNKVTVTGGKLYGVVPGENVTVIYPTEGTVESADAGNNKAVTVVTPSLGGTDAEYYTLSEIKGLTVNITPKTTTFTVTVDPKEYTYNGNERQAHFTVKDNDKVLVSGTDYTVSGNIKATDAGEYTFTVEGKGNYNGTENGSWAIKKETVSSATITLSNNIYTYNKGENKPDVTVVVNSRTLIKDTEYTVAYKDNVNAGTATVTISGTGNYSDTKDAEFTINPKALEESFINVDSDITYDGLSHVVTLSDGETGLVKGTDYTSSGDSETNAGNYTFSATGSGNYTGTVTKSWSIKKRSLNDCTVTIDTSSEISYDGKEKEPTVTVKYNGSDLVSGTDYTLVYKDNVNAGTATVTITGKGNFDGSAEKTFTIGKAIYSEAVSKNVNVYAQDIKSADKTYELNISELGLPDSFIDAKFNGIGDKDSLITAVSKTDGTVSYTVKGGSTAGSEGTFKVTISSKNYNDVTCTVNVKIVNKSDAQISVSTDTIIKTYGDASFTVNANVSSYTDENRTWKWSCDKDNILNISNDNTSTPTISIADVTDTDVKLKVYYEDSDYAAEKEITVKVNKKDVTISGIKAVDKVYNGNGTAVIDESGATIDGILDADKSKVSVDSTNASAVFADVNVGTEKEVTFTGFALAGDKAHCYNLVSVNGATADITALEVTAEPVSGQKLDKVYDGNNKLSDTYLEFTFSDINKNEVKVKAEAFYADKDVGTGKNITVDSSTGVKVSGSEDIKNYEITYDVTGVKGDITPKEIKAVITGPSSSVYKGASYSGSHTASLATLSDVIGDDKVNLNVSYKDASGEDKDPVDAGDYYVSAASDNKNYNVVNDETVFTITKAVPSLTAVARNIRYSDTSEFETDFDAEISGTYTIAFETGTDILTVSGGSKVTYNMTSAHTSSDKGIWGQYKVTFTPADSVNYNVAVTSLKATIIDKDDASDKVSLTMSDFTYGDTTHGPVHSSTITDGVLKGLTYEKNEGTSYTKLETAPSEPGDYRVTVTYESTDEIGTKSADYKISPKELTFVNVSAENKEYDGNTDAVISTGTDTRLAGIVDGDSGFVEIDYSEAKAEFNSADAGTGITVTFTGFGIKGSKANCYTIKNQPESVTANINAKAVTANLKAGQSLNKIYDGNTNVTGEYLYFTFTDVSGKTAEIKVKAAYSDANANDNISILLDSNGKTAEAVTENINLLNYDITFSPSSLTGNISQKTVKAVIEGPSEETYKGSSFVGTHTVRILDTATDVAEKDDPILGIAYTPANAEDAGKYSVDVTCGNRNYTVSYDVFTFTVNKADVDIKSVSDNLRYSNTAEKSADFKVKGVGESQISGKYEVTFVSGTDILSITTGTDLKYKLNKTYTAEDAGTAGKYSITFIPDSGNYNKAYTTLTVEIIDKENSNAKVSLEISDFTYDGNSADPEYSSTIENAAAPSVTYYKEGSDEGFTTAPSEPGKYSVTVTYESPDEIGSKSAEFTIYQKELIWKNVTAESKVYDGNTEAKVGSAELDGVIEADNGKVQVDDTEASATFDTADAGTGKTVAFAGFAIKGEKADCYTITDTPSSSKADITAKPVTANMKEKSLDKVYDGTADVTGDIYYTFTDVNGNVITVKSAASYSDSNAGKDKTITLKNGGNDVEVTEGSVTLSNYSITFAPENIKGNITAKSIKAKVDCDESAEYNGTEFSFTAELTTPSDAISGDSVELEVLYNGKTNKPKDAGKYELSITSDNGNYSIYYDAKTFTVTRATPKSTSVTNSILYSDTAEKTAGFNVTGVDGKGLEGTFTVVYVSGTDIITVTAGKDVKYSLKSGYTAADSGKTGTYKVTFAPDDSTNYNSIETVLTVSIIDKNKLDSEVTVTMNDFTYGDTPSEPVTESKIAGSTITGITYYEKQPEGDYKALENAPTEPGEYKVSVTFESDDSIGTGSDTYTISKRKLSWINIKAADKAYDGSSSATVMTDTDSGLSGAVPGDDVEADYSEARAEFDSADAGSDKVVTFSGFAIKGSKAYCYTLESQPGNVTADISPKAVTAVIKGNVSVNKVYDGSRNITGEYLEYTFTDVANNTVTVKVKAFYSDANAGTGKEIRIEKDGADYTVVSGSINRSNYSVTFNPVTFTGNISKKSVKAVISGSSSETYNGSTYVGSHDVQLATPSDLVSGDVLNLAVEYRKAGVITAPVNAGTYNLSVTWANENYNVYYNSFTFKINKADPSVSNVKDSVRYGDTSEKTAEFSPMGVGSSEISGTYAVSFTSGTDILSVSGGTEVSYSLKSGYTAADAGKNGIYKVVFTPTDTENYNSAETTLSVIIINKEILNNSVSVSMNDFTYGDTPSTPFAASSIEDSSLTGFTYYKKLDGGNYETLSDVPSDPGEYKVSATFESTDAIGTAEAVYKINKKQLTWTGVTIEDKYYDGTAYAYADFTGLKLDGIVGTDNVIIEAYEADNTYAEYKDEEVGNDKDVFVYVDASVSGKDLWKYVLPESYETMKASILAPDRIVRLVVTPTDRNKQVTETDISTYPVGTETDADPRYASFTNIDEVKSKLEESAGTHDGAELHNVRIFFDEEIGQETTPTTLLVPYPSGADKDSTIKVLQIDEDGNARQLESENTELGIRFVLDDETPFLITWYNSRQIKPGSKDKAVIIIEPKKVENEKEENPNTGAFVPGAELAVSAFLLLGAVYVIRKKK